MSAHVCEGCGKSYGTKQAKYAHKKKNPDCKEVKHTDIIGQMAALLQHVRDLELRTKHLETELLNIKHK